MAKTPRRPSKTKIPRPAAGRAQTNKELDLALQQITKDYGDGAIMRLGDRKVMDVEVIPDGQHPDRPRAGRRRRAARAHRGNLRAGKLGQDDADADAGRAGAEARWYGGVHRRGARARSGVRPQAGRQPGRAAHLPAFLRRGSPPHLRDAGAFQRAGRHRRGLRRGARDQAGTRRRDRRFDRRRAGAADERGACAS